MYLTYRPALQTDIDTCLEMLPKQFPHDGVTLRCIADLWSEWLMDRAMLLAVVEDEERSAEEGKIVAFGSSVFVTESFYELAVSSLCPPIAVTVAKHALNGQMPVLSLDQIRGANSGEGLNLLVLVIGWRSYLEDAEYLSRVKAKLFEAFFFMHAGFKIKQFVQEIYTQQEMERGLAIGVEVLTDFARCHTKLPAPDDRIYLMGSSRSTVNEGSAVWPVFLYSPPKFFFSTTEQDLLKMAILGRTDSEIAETLYVTPAAVHKRWRSILDRAQATEDATWLPLNGAAGSKLGRGSEKRSHLLNYLRSHPEELRPIQRPRR